MGPLEYSTIRERIVGVLRSSERPLTAEEISGLLGLNLPPKDIYEHILHAAKSLRSESGGRELIVMEPPYCRKCGYVFKDLTKPKKPSKCPRCKSEWIAPPRFAIIKRG